MSTTDMRQTDLAVAREQRFDWPVCHEAEALLSDRLEAFVARHRFARNLERRMRQETGTLLMDWIDHFVLPENEAEGLRAVGFELDPAGETMGAGTALYHPEALLPRVVLARPRAGEPPGLSLRAWSVADFLAAHDLGGEIEGAPLSRFRRALVSVENGARLDVVERRGYRGFVPANPAPNQLEAFLKARELWQTRRRGFENEALGYTHAQATLGRVVELVGTDLATHVVFEAERTYWQGRNRAAQIQKRRQDALGLGWANHDHHTFRSSREHFWYLMRVLEQLGFERRERYYAGAQAGWGAQILEQPVEGIVVFADLDLMPDEVNIDFSRHPLRPAPRLGTVGLWVGLHGESFLQAGMHHLEARFDFALVRAQLRRERIAGMPPFSDFEFLKQAFTEGERWPVRPERAERLRDRGLITPEQAQQFISQGALGSHLETLQRRGGFKGFNQKSVSAVIAATDPRRHSCG